MPGGGGPGGGFGGGGGPDMGGMPGDGGMDQQYTYKPTAASDLKSLTKKLKLTDDQQTQIKTILSDRDQQITDLVNQASAARKASNSSSNSSTASGAQSSNNPGQMMAVFMKERTIKESANTKIEEVLTADQMKKFESWVKSQSQNESGMGGPGGDMGGGGMPGGGGGGPGGGGPGGGGGGGGPM